MENNTEKRVCKTCAYVKPTGSGFYKGHISEFKEKFFLESEKEGNMFTKAERGE